MNYEVVGYREYSGYDKVYFSVEADSTEEALKLVKDGPDEFEVDYKILDITSAKYVDFGEWEVR